MDYLRKSAGVSRFQNFSTTVIRKQMQVEYSVLDRIKRSNWYDVNTYLKVWYSLAEPSDNPLEWLRYGCEKSFITDHKHKLSFLLKL